MKNLTLLFSFILSSFYFNAQQYESQNKKAIKLFELGLNDYRSNNLSGAVINLEKAIAQDQVFTDAHTLLGLIYSDQKNFDLALNHLYKAVEINPNFESTNYYQIAIIEMKLAKYEQAHKNLTTFLSIENIHPKAKISAQRMIKNAEFAKKAILSPVEFEPVNMGKNINSNYNEYFPTITTDHSRLLYTRMLPSNESMSGYQEDFYFAKFQEDSWSEARNFGPPVNTAENEGAPAIAPDGKTIFFTVCESYGKYGAHRNGFGSCDIFKSQLSGGKWSPAENLGQTVNSRNWESQPSFSSDGKTLYFVRRVRNKRTLEQDIFTTTLQDDGSWSTPQPLPEVINTDGREESVFIHPDDQTLYFSSDGHPGFGGLDIFVSKKDSSGQWQTPINLGYPINTASDENSLLVNPKGDLAYFASEREGGFGNMDLYQFELPTDLRANPVSFAKGIVFDASSKIRLGAKFELIDLETKKVVVSSFSDRKNGDFLVSLPSGKSYALNVSKKGYLFYSENFTFEKTNSLEPQKLKVPLQPIAINNSIVLKNIFFETNKFDLLDQSIVELEKLFEFLTNNASISIEIGGHTDNQGAKTSNQKLSEHRAKSVKDYLTSKGISPDRITSKGYADNAPIAENTTKEGRAQNRRTEFKITKK